MTYQLRISLPGLPDLHVLLHGHGPWVLGSSSDVEVPLHARGVSRRHAELSLDAAGALYVRDLGSTNGTLRNGERCAGVVVAVPGAVLELGQAIVRVESNATEALGFAPALDGLAAQTLIEVRDVAVAGAGSEDPCSLSGFVKLVERFLAASPTGEQWTELCRLFGEVLGCSAARCYLLRDDAICLRAAIGELSDELVPPGLARACALLPVAATFHGKGGGGDGLLLVTLPVRLPVGRVVLLGVMPPGHDPIRLRPEVLTALPVLVRLVLTWAEQIESDREAISDLKKRLEELRRGGSTSGLRREPILGASRVLMAALEAADRVAPTEMTVLLLGETGTGKELLARRIHDLSPRAGGPFVPVNCAAIPATQIEAELFGAERGAYTGLDRRRVGRIESAAGGTLFLDEIADMPDALQAALLRVIEDHMIAPLGGTLRKVDVRLIAATNRELRQALEEGHFRRDLYFRLAGVTVELAPLRQRDGDVFLLANAFIEAANRELGRTVLGLDEEALTLLEGHSWPGNVRELLAVVKNLVLNANGPVITAGQVRAVLARSHAGPAQAEAQPWEMPWADARDAFEREYFSRRLQAHQGSLTALAAEVGITRPNLHVKLRKLGISLDPEARRP